MYPIKFNVMGKIKISGKSKKALVFSFIAFILLLTISAPITIPMFRWHVNLRDILSHPVYLKPIKLENKGIVSELDFQIKKDGVYIFALRFNFEENHPEDKKRASEMMALQNLMNIVIFKTDEGKEQEIFSAQKNTFFIAHSSNHFDKKIIKLKLASGYYRVKIKNVSPSSLFFEQPVDFIIYRRF